MAYSISDLHVLNESDDNVLIYTETCQKLIEIRFCDSLVSRENSSIVPPTLTLGGPKSDVVERRTDIQHERPRSGGRSSLVRASPSLPPPPRHPIPALPLLCFVTYSSLPCPSLIPFFFSRASLLLTSGPVDDSSFVMLIAFITLPLLFPVSLFFTRYSRFSLSYFWFSFLPFPSPTFIHYPVSSSPSTSP